MLVDHSARKNKLPSRSKKPTNTFLMFDTTYVALTGRTSLPTALPFGFCVPTLNPSLVSCISDVLFPSLKQNLTLMHCSLKQPFPNHTFHLKYTPPSPPKRLTSNTWACLLPYSLALWHSESLGLPNYECPSALSTAFCHQLSL